MDQTAASRVQDLAPLALWHLVISTMAWATIGATGAYATYTIGGVSALEFGKWIWTIHMSTPGSARPRPPTPGCRAFWGGWYIAMGSVLSIMLLVRDARGTLPIIAAVLMAVASTLDVAYMILYWRYTTPMVVSPSAQTPLQAVV